MVDYRIVYVCIHQIAHVLPFLGYCPGLLQQWVGGVLVHRLIEKRLDIQVLAPLKGINETLDQLSVSRELRPSDHLVSGCLLMEGVNLRRLLKQAQTFIRGKVVALGVKVVIDLRRLFVTTFDLAHHLPRRPVPRFSGQRAAGMAAYLIQLTR